MTRRRIPLARDLYVFFLINQHDQKFGQQPINLSNFTRFNYCMAIFPTYMYLNGFLIL